MQSKNAESPRATNMQIKRDMSLINLIFTAIATIFCVFLQIDIGQHYLLHFSKHNVSPILPLFICICSWFMWCDPHHMRT